MPEREGGEAVQRLVNAQPRTQPGRVLGRARVLNLPLRRRGHEPVDRLAELVRVHTGGTDLDVPGNVAHHLVRIREPVGPRGKERDAEG